MLGIIIGYTINLGSGMAVMETLERREMLGSACLGRTLFLSNGAEIKNRCKKVIIIFRPRGKVASSFP
jgi:hypothetical protein